MPRKRNDISRAANGDGSIRKKTLTRNGKTYEYWEARYTAGTDPLTGKQIQRTITGKTQKEVAQRLRQVTSELDLGSYVAPCKTTLAEWLMTWQDEYLGSIKESSRYNYKRDIELYIVPVLGSVKLDALNTTQIQKLYNSLTAPPRSLSAKTVKDIHGVLHSALQQAVDNRLIRYNPSDACKLPKVLKKELRILAEDEIAAFLKEISGHAHEHLYRFSLFSGMREAEILGLTWDCVDFEHSTVTVKQQLRRHQEKGKGYYISSTKNTKSRIIKLAPSAMQELRLQKQKLEDMKQAASELWVETPMIDTPERGQLLPYDLVFRNNVGELLSYRTVYDCYKRVVAKLGIPELRFHDLRHSYAAAALRCGDDIKTLQENLGHATAAFTLNVYGHVTEQMKNASADRMEQFIQGLSG